MYAYKRYLYIRFQQICRIVTEYEIYLSTQFDYETQACDYIVTPLHYRDIWLGINLKIPLFITYPENHYFQKQKSN